MAGIVKHSLPEWIAHVFDHPVADPAWYLEVDAPQWEDTPEHIATCIANSFEHSGELFAPFSDEQIDQGLWYLAGVSSDGLMDTLVDSDVPASLRLRALRSFVPLFEQVMTARCSPQLSHIDEPGAKPLNSACYMWWDILAIFGRPDAPERAEFDSEVLAVLQQLLAIPHDACRESALHGIGHWSSQYPNLIVVIDNFLSHTPNLRPELVAYAQSAKTGVL